jgi:hypothetical protein
MIKLDVPYHEKDLVKRLGALWSREHQTWYVPPGMLISSFECWLPTMQPAKKLLREGRPKARIDSITGKITIGAHYVEAVGASGPPWAT